MGTLSEGACRAWQGRLAMWAIGRLDEDEAGEVAEHLGICPACREEAAELEEVAGLLSLVEIGSVSDVPQRPDWRTAPVPHPGGEARSAATPPSGRWRGSRGANVLDGGFPGIGVVRRAVVAVGGLAAAVAVAASLVATSGGTIASATRSMTLNGPPGVQATVALAAARQGSQAVLVESGLPAGTTYAVSMESQRGYQWLAGSYRSTSGTTRVTLYCPVRPGQISEVWVTGPTGRTVLSGYA